MNSNLSPAWDETWIPATFRSLLEAAPDAMVIVDRAGLIVLTNQQTNRLFGYTNEELVGQKVEILVPARFRSKHPGHRAGFFSAPRTRSMGAGLDLLGAKGRNRVSGGDKPESGGNTARHSNHERHT